MSRRKRRRREPATELVPAPPVVEQPVNWPRLRQVYSNMRGRGVTLNFVSIGPIVDARTPAEMLERTELALAAFVKDDPPN